jgi:hypothetical protein
LIYLTKRLAIKPAIATYSVKSIFPEAELFLKAEAGAKTRRLSGSV